MNNYEIKIVVASAEGASYFDRSANIQCARAIKEGYRLHSASPLSVQVGETGKALYSQTFIFEKGEKLK
jgi:hypothetical protein